MLLKDKDVLIFMGDSVTDADRVKPDSEGLFNAYGLGYVNMINMFVILTIITAISIGIANIIYRYT